MCAFLVFYIAVVILIPHNVQSANILGLFPYTGKSHHMVFEPLLQKLAVKGHRLTVASFFPLKNPPVNYTDVSFQGLSSIGIEVIDLTLLEDHKLIRSLGIERLLGELFGFAMLGDLALDVCEKIVSWTPLAEVLSKEYDIIIMENFNSDCILGLLHVYGNRAPIVALSSSGVMPWLPQRIGVSDNPSHVPVIFTEFTEKMNYLQRMENVLVHLYAKLWYRYVIQVKEQSIIEKHFRRKIPDLDGLSKNISLLLLNTFHTLNGVRPTLPGVVEVGGIHLERDNQDIPQHIERFLNESKKGVVLFSLGSMVKTNSMPKYKEDIFINVLSRLGQRVIWKYEDSPSEGNITNNILKVKWIPQFELLKHKKIMAYIGHGGLLGMTEAIYAGKPMVVIPFFGDQPLNAAAAANVGVAKVISYNTLSEEILSEALQDVLSPEMRLRASRVSQIWRDRQNSPLDTAIFNIERIIRWDNQDQLYSASRDLNFFQYTLLDVFGAYIAVILLICLLLRITFSLLLRGMHFLTKEKLKKS